MKPASPTERIALRIDEIHRVVPWGRTTTYKLVKQGRLPARKLGSSTFVLVDDLLEFLRSLPRRHEADIGASLVLEAGQS